MSEYIHRSHNVTVLIYHLVFPAKYRRAVIDEQVDIVLKDVCLEIEKKYQIRFLEIGTDVLGPISTNLLGYKDRNDGQELDRAGSVSAMSPGEKTVVGWGVLDRWLCCHYGRQTW